jgi:hypothetical protein
MHSLSLGESAAVAAPVRQDEGHGQSRVTGLGRAPTTAGHGSPAQDLRSGGGPATHMGAPAGSCKGNLKARGRVRPENPSHILLEGVVPLGPRPPTRTARTPCCARAGSRIARRRDRRPARAGTDVGPARTATAPRRRRGPGRRGRALGDGRAAHRAGPAGLEGGRWRDAQGRPGWRTLAGRAGPAWMADSDIGGPAPRPGLDGLDGCPSPAAVRPRWPYWREARGPCIEAVTPTICTGTGNRRELECAATGSDDLASYYLVLSRIISYQRVYSSR